MTSHDGRLLNGFSKVIERQARGNQQGLCRAVAEGSTLIDRARCDYPFRFRRSQCRKKPATAETVRRWAELRQAEFEHRRKLFGRDRSGGITNDLERIVCLDFLCRFHQIGMRLLENPVWESLLTQIRNSVLRHAGWTPIDEHLPLQFCDCDVRRIRPLHSFRSKKSPYFAHARRALILN